MNDFSGRLKLVQIVDGTTPDVFNFQKWPFCSLLLNELYLFQKMLRV